MHHLILRNLGVMTRARAPALLVISLPYTLCAIVIVALAQLGLGGIGVIEAHRLGCATAAVPMTIYLGVVNVAGWPMVKRLKAAFEQGTDGVSETSHQKLRLFILAQTIWIAICGYPVFVFIGASRFLYNPQLFLLYVFACSVGIASAPEFFLRFLW